MELSKAALAELIQQMPPTDRELEAIKAAQQATEAEKPKEDSKPAPPAPTDPASKFTGPDPAVSDRMCSQILESGRATILELVGMIRDPADPEFANYKAEYVLHCLVLYAGRPGREAQRRLMTDALASPIGDEKIPKPVRGLVIRELRWIGDKAVTNELVKVLNDEELCRDAIMTWVTLGGPSQPLRTALENAKGRTRLALVQSLAVLRDERSVELLRTMVGDEDPDIRLTAAFGLANLADANSSDALLKLADTQTTYERAKATQSCLVLAEKLVAAGKLREAARIYTHLRDTRKDKTEKYIRDLSETALRSLVV